MIGDLKLALKMHEFWKVDEINVSKKVFMEVVQLSSRSPASIRLNLRQDDPNRFYHKANWNGVVFIYVSHQAITAPPYSEKADLAQIS